MRAEHSVDEATRDGARDNCLEEAQPAQANHEAARRMEKAIRRRQGSVRFGRLSSGSRTLCADYGPNAATGIGAQDATEMFGFWLRIHSGLKHEWRGCSLPSS